MTHNSAMVGDQGWRSGEGAGLPDEGDRKRFSQLVTNAFERGLISEEEYARRSQALQTATSSAQMAQIVQEMPLTGVSVQKGKGARARSRSHTQVSGGTGSRDLPRMRAGGTPSTSRDGVGGMDPVDLARLWSVEASDRRGGDHRWAALILIVMLFAVLAVLGLVLAVRVHPAPTGAGTGAGAAMPLAVSGTSSGDAGPPALHQPSSEVSPSSGYSPSSEVSPSSPARWLRR